MRKSKMESLLGVLFARAALLILGIAIQGLAGPSYAEQGGPRVGIRTPQDQRVYNATRQSIEIEGYASVPGAAPKFDLMLLLDTSRSLANSDPYGHRITGSMHLIDSLPGRGDTRIGIVSFGRRAEIVVPLTTSRRLLAEGIRNLTRGGFTELSEGLRMAVEVLEREGRRDATRAILVFSDGRSDSESVRRAAEHARRSGVVIHALQLGAGEPARKVLREAAAQTGGRFGLVTSAESLSDQLSSFRTTGLESVRVRINGQAPTEVTLVADDFKLIVELEVGENRIEAIATSLDGQTATDEVSVFLRPPDCGELRIGATLDGRPAISLSQRSVEIVLDASGSMWGKLNERFKMTVAVETLRELLTWVPAEVQLGLRVYGHRDDREVRNCRDTERLVPSGFGNRDRIRSAIAALEPRGQTPIAYALRQAALDLGALSGQRTVVLLTDGIESCGGDGPAAARALQKLGPIPVHVIGLGIEGEEPEKRQQLEEIARASGGLFLTASNAVQLRDALRSVVGTRYEVMRDGRRVAVGTLGGDEAIALPAGKYQVRLEGEPTVTVPIEISGERSHRLTFDMRRGRLSHATEATDIERFSCDLPMGSASDRTLSD